MGCYLGKPPRIYVEKRVVKMRRHGDREIPGVDSWTSSFNGASLVVIMYLYYQQGRISNKGSSSRNSSIGYGSMLGTILINLIWLVSTDWFNWRVVVLLLLLTNCSAC